MTPLKPVTFRNRMVWHHTNSPGKVLQPYQQLPQNGTAVFRIERQGQSAQSRVQKTLNTFVQPTAGKDVILRIHTCKFPSNHRFEYHINKMLVTCCLYLNILQRTKTQVKSQVSNNVTKKLQTAQYKQSTPFEFTSSRRICNSTRGPSTYSMYCFTYRYKGTPFVPLPYTYVDWRLNLIHVIGYLLGSWLINQELLRSKLFTYIIFGVLRRRQINVLLNEMLLWEQ